MAIRSFLRSFEVEDDPTQRTFFTEIVSSISDMKIAGRAVPSLPARQLVTLELGGGWPATTNGRFILARDYLTLKVWAQHWIHRTGSKSSRTVLQNTCAIGGIRSWS